MLRLCGCKEGRALHDCGFKGTQEAQNRKALIPGMTLFPSNSSDRYPPFMVCSFLTGNQSSDAPTQYYTFPVHVHTLHTLIIHKSTFQAEIISLVEHVNSKSSKLEIGIKCEK